MAIHILGKAIKHNVEVKYGLAFNIFGVGLKTAEQICARIGIYPKMRMNQLNETQIMAINKELSDITVEGHLKQKVWDDIKLKRTIGSYAGLRHAMGLPVRGQKTKNNARTAKKLNKLERRL
ncbi:uncharacterized protein KQ657_004562 [Scheffersomyces spartinae]|uniref:Small ribosomal subunit protein uS13m n=1 Tax=Scheffersomyces spartinae TaxID=45513 RepID=A0A9P7VAV9_9ASCO|nr:uncharacterized protein KQ657_004562 [Scheffersomyces spartinae]KAG7194350.1 hypothetical protein KQ657_004562 [Scheffersomyces spartinae]